MYKRIYKYKLQITDKQEVKLPMDSLILSVHNVKDELCLYALINPDQPFIHKRIIEIFGTGNDVRCDMGIERKFLGTVILQNNYFVAHVFERIS